jgi:hypothetical protein
MAADPVYGRTEQTLRAAVREWEKTRPALPDAAFVDIHKEGVKQIRHIPQKLQEIKKRSVVALSIAP